MTVKQAARQGIKWLLLMIMVLLAWLLVSYVVESMARGYVKFLAFSVTGSRDCGGGCQKFTWDKPLQSAVYSTYAIIFILYTLWLAKYLKLKDSKKSQWIVGLVFVLFFPSYTAWGVHSECRGFGGCAVGYRIAVVVPVILSKNLLAMALSSSLALACLKLYTSNLKR